MVDLAEPDDVAVVEVESWGGPPHAENQGCFREGHLDPVLKKV